jgi:hypothetical protein
MSLAAIAMLAAQQIVATSQTKLLPPSTSASEAGVCVLLLGNTAFVSDWGTPQDRLLLYQDQAGTWSYQSSLNKSVECLAADGDWMIAGDGDYSYMGTAYAMRRVGGVWQYFQELAHPNWDNYSIEEYGWAVAIDGERAAISNPQHQGLDDVHIWQYSSALGYWRVTARVTSGAGGAAAQDFGAGVALRGDDLLVASKTGVQHFQYDALLGQWVFQSVILTGLHGGSGPDFHRMCWSAEDVLAVGDPFDSTMATDSGAVCVLERFGTQWSLAAKIFSNAPQASSRFGWSLDVRDGTLAVGSPFSNLAATQAGAVELFARNGGWQHAGTLISSDPNAYDWYGQSVSLASGMSPLHERLLTSAPLDDELGNEVGAAYVLELEHADAKVYCTSKLNSLGCLPRVAFTGTPSVSSASPFTISASNVLNQRAGVFFYSIGGRDATPFKGGFKCIASPYRRANGTLSSGGTPPGTDDCSGVLALDFNSWIRSGVDPTLSAGKLVDGQFFSRDGASSFGTSISEAVEFEIRP